MNQTSQQRIMVALQRAAESDFDLSVAELAGLAGYSPGHFQRLFRRQFGISPGQLLRHSRIQQFAERLRAGAGVTEAALAAGFESSSRSHQAAEDGLGMPPSRLARGGQGQTIDYAITGSSLGRILTAATARGLCAVMLGDEDAALEADLRGRFPRAEVRPAGPDFRAIQQRVLKLIDRAAPAGPELPLDLHGTVFQLRVWTALQKIPAGRTVTYGELAQQVGLPGGARAVAQACGANPAAVVVPCHRVVAADGGLGGYRWGVERKRALINRESEMTKSPGNPAG